MNKWEDEDDADCFSPKKLKALKKKWEEEDQYYLKNNIKATIPVQATIPVKTKPIQTNFKNKSSNENVWKKNKP